MIAMKLLFFYGAVAQFGQSTRLIIGRSQVQVLPAPQHTHFWHFSSAPTHEYGYSYPVLRRTNAGCNGFVYNYNYSFAVKSLVCKSQNHKITHASQAKVGVDCSENGNGSNARHNVNCEKPYKPELIEVKKSSFNVARKKPNEYQPQVQFGRQLTTVSVFLSVGHSSIAITEWYSHLATEKNPPLQWW